MTRMCSKNSVKTKSKHLSSMIYSHRVVRSGRSNMFFDVSLRHSKYITTFWGRLKLLKCVNIFSSLNFIGITVQFNSGGPPKTFASLCSSRWTR
jgi:hypothetical protein